MNPRKRKAPEGTGADATTRHHQPESYTELRILRDRIDWLTKPGRCHWWLRTPEGRSQLEFLEGRDAA